MTKHGGVHRYGMCVPPMPWNGVVTPFQENGGVYLSPARGRQEELPGGQGRPHTGNVTQQADSRVVSKGAWVYLEV